MAVRQWDGIEEAVAVEQAGSFSAAAAALGVSTSHVSRAVIRLENLIQAQIFHRTTRRVTLTDTGRILIAQLKRIIQERDEALAGVNAGGEPQGELRITCSTALGERFIAPVVREFAQEHPRLSVGLELSNRLVDLVAEGFDLAIRTGHLADSRLIGTCIATRAVHLCAAPAYLAERGSPCAIDELGQHECLVGTSSTWHFKIVGWEQAYRPRGRWRCNSGTAIVDAALAGMGICQLPDFYVARHIQAGRLVRLLPDIDPDDEAIWAVYPQRRHLQPKVRRLVDHLRTELPRRLGADYP